MLAFLHTNFFYFCAKTQLQMFQFYIYHELSFAQIASSHYTFFLLYIVKMMMNVMVTSQPMAEYSTRYLFLLFSNVLLLLFLLPPPTFICAHSSALPFPFLFSIVFQLHSLHSCCYELQNLKMHRTSNNKDKLLLTIILFFSVLERPTHHIHFFIYPPSFS
jgi:hypothetical protein